MANWCDNTITFYGENVNKLDNYLKEWTKESLPGVGFGKRWLGNCLVNSGIMSFDEASNGNVDCRGSIEDWDIIDKDTLVMNTSTAWYPMMDMWFLINNKLNLNLEITYLSIEFGCEIYETNDPTYKNLWYVEEEESIVDYESTKDYVDKRYTSLIAKYPNTESKYVEDDYAYVCNEDGEYIFNAYKWNYIENN